MDSKFVANRVSWFASHCTGHFLPVYTYDLTGFF